MNIFISFNNGSLARRRGKGGKYQQQIQVQSNRDGPNINEKFWLSWKDCSDENKIVLKYI